MDDEIFNAANLTRQTFHGEWNYVTRPQPNSRQLFLRAPYYRDHCGSVSIPALEGFVFRDHTIHIGDL